MKQDIKEAKFKAFFEAGALAKFIVDEDLIIRDASRYAASMAGGVVLTGSHIAKFFYTSPAKIEKFFRKKIDGMDQDRAQVTVKKDEKICFYDVMIHAHFYPKMHAVFVWDVTEIEQERRRRELFLSTVGHELKNPIAVIKAYAQMAQLKLAKARENKLADYLKTIDHKTDVLTKLINDVVDELYISAHKFALVKTEVEINQVVEETVAEYKKTHPTHQFVVKNSIRAKVKADAERIQQVIGNLLSNAVKYSPPATEIEISMKETETTIDITVTDHGMGIGKNEQLQVFEAFYRVKPKNAQKIPGLGLGLYLNKQIIDLHGGSMSLKSAPDKGTRIGFSLPKGRE